MSCVPSYLENILQQAPETASLRHLALGGEALTLQFKDKVSRHLNVAQITNLYGPTEATIDAISLAVAERRRRRQHPDRPSDGQLSGLRAGRQS